MRPCPAAWRAAGAAAHFLAALVSVAGGREAAEGTALAAAAAAGRRVLGLEHDDATATAAAAGAGAAAVAGAGTGAGVLAPHGLAAAALDSLFSGGASDGSDGAFAARAAAGVALHGALRLVAAVPGAATAPPTAPLAARAVRHLTVATTLAARANALEDGVLRAGRSPLGAAAELPAQRALIVALELQEAAAAAAADEIIRVGPAGARQGHTCIVLPTQSQSSIGMSGLPLQNNSFGSTRVVSE